MIKKIVLLGLVLGMAFLLCCQSDQKASSPAPGQANTNADEPVVPDDEDEIVITEEMIEKTQGKKLSPEQVSQMCSEETIRLLILCDIVKDKNIEANMPKCREICENGKVRVKHFECFQHKVCKDVHACIDGVYAALYGPQQADVAQNDQPQAMLPPATTPDSDAVPPSAPLPETGTPDPGTSHPAQDAGKAPSENAPE